MIKLIRNILGTGRALKWLFNISPMYRATGGRVVHASDDFKYIKIKLPLTYRTRNYVGTLYGGHMYSAADGLYMVQLINILGKEYVVWDKSASIRFRRPGNRTLYAEFIITDELLDQIKEDIQTVHEKDYVLKVDLVDAEGKVYANVEKVIYIASKDFYKEKRKNKESSK